MQCFNCGTELPDEAGFCWKCGRPQAPTSEPDADFEVGLVDCKLVTDARQFSSWLGSHDWFHGARLQFVAQASGPSGNYVAAESPVFKAEAEFPPPDDDPRSQRVYQKFVMDLVDQGWEMMGTQGGEWFNQRLRRRVGRRAAP